MCLPICATCRCDALAQRSLDFREPPSVPSYTPFLSHNNPVRSQTRDLKLRTPLVAACRHRSRHNLRFGASPASGSTSPARSLRASSNLARTSSEARARLDGRGSNG